MQKLVLSAAMTIFTTLGASAQTIINEWKFDTAKELQNVAFHSSKGNEFSRRSNTEVKTPDGQNTLELTIEAVKPNAVSYDKQVNFYSETPLLTTDKYKIQFWCKGSVEGEIGITAAMAVTPFKALALNATKKIKINDQWQLVTLEFMPSENFTSKIAVPRFMPGTFPPGGKLYLGPVRFSREVKFLPLTLNSQWQVFADVKEPVAISSFLNIPSELPGGKGQIKALPVKPIDNTIDLAVLAGGAKLKAVALLMNEFESTEAGTMQIGVSADWWMELAVNGKKVYDTLNFGNISNRYRPEDHVFNFPVVKGKNLIVAKVLSGSQGWRWVAGKVAFQDNPDQLKIIAAGKDWKAIDMNKLIVKPGTGLDFTSLVGQRTTAGALGRVLINQQGNLAFANTPLHTVRFFSFNFLPSAGWRMKMDTWTNQDYENFTDTISRQGYNMVRLHFIDTFLLGAKFPGRPKRSITEVGIPQKAEDIAFDSQVIDRFDFLISCLKKKGIYVNLDLMTAETGYTMTYGSPEEKTFRIQLFVNPEYRKHWEAATGYLFNHRNPYTGTSLKDDPVLAIVEPYNEQDLLIYYKAGMTVLTPHFQKYLKDKYQTDEALQKAWNDTNITLAKIPDINEEMLRGNDSKAEDAGRFLISTMTDMTKWYHEIIRKNGYPGIITQWDMIMRTMEIPVRALMPAIAQHSYFAHPNCGNIPTRNLVKKNFNTWWNAVGNPAFDAMTPQESSINSSYFRAAATARFLDRPFLITEYSHSAWNRYRHERGLYFGTYAALQGWDSLAAHGRLTAEKFNISIPFATFENAIDPISRASEVVAALTWFRRDVKEAPHSVQLNLSDKTMFPKNFLAAVGDDYAKLAMLTKIGIAYPEVKPLDPVGKVNPTLELPLMEFSPLGVSQWYVTASNIDGNVFPELLKKIKDGGILPKSNRTDYAKRLFQSETGEITLNGQDETMTVITPRLEGAIIKKNMPVKLGRMEIESCSKPASVVVASLDNEKTIAESKRLLLVFSTNALNSGMTFENSNMSLMVEVGNLPVLMETAKLTLTLKFLNNTAPAIYALNMDGTRAEQVPCTFKDGKLALSLDTFKLQYATPFFEIAFP